MDADAGFPLPPEDLIQRVGTIDATDVTEEYRRIGHRSRRAILHALNGVDRWKWSGARVLDFGCGSGRVLRHMGAEAEQAAGYVGCDIDAASVDWVNANLSPSFGAFRNEHAPPLPLDDGSIDFAYAFSVFTHLTDHIYDWLLELHRVLAVDGLLLATFLGPGMSELVAEEPWSPAKFGQTFVGYARPWDPGPNVIHSGWWIKAHWGRAFEVLRIQPAGFGMFPPPEKPTGHGWVLLRKKEGSFTADDLAAPTDDPRELTAAIHASERYLAEIGYLRNELARAHNSLSWRVTRPLREVNQIRRRLMGDVGSPEDVG